MNFAADLTAMHAQGSQLRRQYPHPPIVEVVLDVRVVPSKEFDVSDLDNLRQTESRHYPTAEEMVAVELEGTFQAGMVPQTQTRQDLIGCRLRTAENSAVVVLQRDGFGFSRLPPYVGWEDVRDEAHRLWNAYVSAAIPEKATRLAVRYINRIDIPLPASDLSEYLVTAPTLAPGIPQLLAGYAMELQLPQPGFVKGGAVIRQALVQPPSPAVVSIIFDVDVFQAVEFAPDDESIWIAFEALHDRENLLFERSITDKVREIFG